MIQSNLGNALQYAPSGHPLENNLRALSAYDEALKVRNRRDTPVEYANTIANKANALRNLPREVPAELEEPSAADPLVQALALYREAHELFAQFGLEDRAALMKTAIGESESELAWRGDVPRGQRTH